MSGALVLFKLLKHDFARPVLTVSSCLGQLVACKILHEQGVRLSSIAVKVLDV